MWSLILSFMLILLLICIPKIRSPFTSTEMWAMSFGGGDSNFHNAVDRIQRELTAVELFDKIVTYKDDDLKKDTEFWNKHASFIENNKRGYGYWIWKPYLILKTMEHMKEGDTLFYVDAGCEVVNDDLSKPNIIKMNERCKKHNLLYTTTPYAEKNYSKMDLFYELDVDIDDSGQRQATIVFLTKNELTLEFVKEWYEVSNRYPLVDDSPSTIPNSESFFEHRHDQSIFSLLIKSDKYKIHLNQPENIIEEAHPFLLSRKRM